MENPKISAMTFDGNGWGGWSNSTGTLEVKSVEDAVSKIKTDPELGWRIIDADNLRIYVSDMKYADRAVESAEINFGVLVPSENITVGFPK